VKGYIYTMFKGADPGVGWHMTDPIFGKVPTLGACMPTVRRVVVPGDCIFFISGQAPGVQQYMVGGFHVAEKLNALAAYERFPANRMKALEDGSLHGNIIVNRDGTKNPFDYHSNFERRVENYVVGRDPLVLERPEEVEVSREQTLDTLQDVFGKSGSRVYDVVGRWRRLDENQIRGISEWLETIKTEPRG
jgi:hypothetical protein